MQERCSLIVYFKSPKVLKRIKKLGNIAYYSKKRKYAVLYINKDDEQKVRSELEALRHVKRVDDSRLDDSPYTLEEPGEPSSGESDGNSDSESDSSDTMSSKNP